VRKSTSIFLWIRQKFAISLLSLNTWRNILIREGDFKTLNWLEQVLADEGSDVNERTLAKFCDEKLRENAFDDLTLKYVGQAFSQLRILQERHVPNPEIKTALALSSKLKSVDAFESYRLLTVEYKDLGKLLKTPVELRDRILILEHMSSLMKRLITIQRQLCVSFSARAEEWRFAASL
jgi:hypothetical protein